MLPVKAEIGSIVIAKLGGKDRPAVVLRIFSDGRHFVIGITRDKNDIRDTRPSDFYELEFHPDSHDCDALDCHTTSYFTKGLAARVTDVDLWRHRVCTPRLLDALYVLIGIRR